MPTRYTDIIPELMRFTLAIYIMWNSEFYTKKNTGEVGRGSKLRDGTIYIHFPISGWCVLTCPSELRKATRAEIVGYVNDYLL